MSMLRTGIFGGSFNPVHNGHVTLAARLLKAARLDEVWLMVTPQYPWKRQEELLDDDTRLALARMAVEDVPGLVASDYEMHLPKPSYTWTTALQRVVRARQNPGQLRHRHLSPSRLHREPRGVAPRHTPFAHAAHRHQQHGDKGPHRPGSSHRPPRASKGGAGHQPLRSLPAGGERIIKPVFFASQT